MSIDLEPTQEIQIPEKPNKSKLYTYLGIAIVILFAIYMIFSAANADDASELNINVPSESSEESTPDGKGEEGLLSAGQFGEPGELNTWRNGEGSFTAETPHEWEVHQIDAGSVSIVEMYEPSDVNYSVTLWLQDSAFGIDGISITFNEWVTGSLENMNDVKECTDREIGGLHRVAPG